MTPHSTSYVDCEQFFPLDGLTLWGGQAPQNQSLLPIFKEASVKVSKSLAGVQLSSGKIEIPFQVGRKSSQH